MGCFKKPPAHVWLASVLQLNGLRSAMQNMLAIYGRQSLTQAMQQRMSEYSVEVRSVPQINLLC